MAPKKKISVPADDVPQNVSDASALLHKIGVLARTLESHTAARDEAVAAAVREHAALIETVSTDLTTQVAKLQAFGESHKTQLLADGGRSVALADGAFGWRLGNPAVKLDRGTTEEDAIEMLRRAGLTQFIRVSEEINKVAILDAPDAVADLRGISIEQAEAFWVRPLQIDDEIAGKAKKLKGSEIAKPDADQPKKKGK